MRCLGSTIATILLLMCIAAGSSHSQLAHSVQLRLQHVDSSGALVSWEQPAEAWGNYRLEIQRKDGEPVISHIEEIHGSRPDFEGSPLVYTAPIFLPEDATGYRITLTGRKDGGPRQQLGDVLELTTPLAAPEDLDFGFEETGELLLTWLDQSWHDPDHRLEASDDGGKTWNPVAFLEENWISIPLTPAHAEWRYRIRSEVFRPGQPTAVSHWVGPIEPRLDPVRRFTADVDDEVYKPHEDPDKWEWLRANVELDWDTTDHEPAFYVVESKLSTSEKWSVVAGSPFHPHESAAILEGFPDGLEYDFRIRREIQGRWAGSEEAVELTEWRELRDVRIPSKRPTKVNAIALTPTSVAVEWVDNSETEKGYVIQRQALPDGLVQKVGTVEADTERFIDETVPGPGTKYRYRVSMIDHEGATRTGNVDTYDPVDTQHHDAAVGGLSAPPFVVVGTELDHSVTITELNRPHAYVRIGIRGSLRAPSLFWLDWTNIPIGQSWIARVFANGDLLEEEKHTVLRMDHIGGGLFRPIFMMRQTPGLQGAYDDDTLLYPTQANTITMRVTVTGELCTSGALGPVLVVAGPPSKRP